LNSTIIIPDSGPGYLPGARILALLAHPPRASSDKKWRQAELQLCRSVLLARQQIDPAWAQVEQSVVPEHLIYPSLGIEQKLEKLRVLHGHRMAAAHVAIPFFQEALRRGGGDSKTKRRIPTIDSRIQMTIDQEADRQDWLKLQNISLKARFPWDDHNFEQRVFRPSLPVLHLAVAVAVVIDRSQKALRTGSSEEPTSASSDMAGPQISIADFLLDPAYALTAVRLAEEYERLIPDLPKVRIPCVVQLRLG